MSRETLKRLKELADQENEDRQEGKSKSIKHTLAYQKYLMDLYRKIKFV